jgi:hypothetical protein
MKAMDFIASNPDASNEIGAKYSKVTASEFSEQMKGVKLMNKTDNVGLMYYKSGIDSLHGSVNQAYLFLKTLGLTSKPVDSTSIIDSNFIRNLP